ncbi:MAG: SseB family protein [Acidimicrobiales bacterium]
MAEPVAVGRGLLDATVLVPTPDPPSLAGTVELVVLDVVTAALHEDEAGLAFPAFTSREAVLRWRPEGAVCVERPGRWAVELAAVGPDGRLAVDPGSPRAVLLGAAELAAVLAGGAGDGGDPGGPGGPGDPGDLAGGSPAGIGVLVASPAVGLADDVAAAVSAAVAAEPAATSARHVVVDQGDGTPGPCVAVAFDEQVGADQVAAAMGRIVAGVAARTSAAAGLTFIVAAGELRPLVDGSGSEVWAR